MPTRSRTVFAALLARPQPAPPRRRITDPAWFGHGAGDAPADEGEAAGAGWFESSAELRRGLAVQEVSGFDAFQRACDALQARQDVAATTRPTTLPSSITAIA